MINVANISIKNRILTVVVLIIAIMSYASVILIDKVSYLDKKVSFMYDVNYVELKTLFDLQSNISKQMVILNQDVSTYSEILKSPAFEGSSGKIQLLMSRFDSDSNEYQSINTLMQTLKTNYEALNANYDVLARHVDQFEYVEAESLVRNIILPQGEKIYEVISAISDGLRIKTVQDIRVISEDTKIFMLGLAYVVVIGVLVGLCSFLIIRKLSSQLSEISSLMQNVAEGDYDVQIPYASQKDEIGKIAQSLDFLKKRAIEVKVLRDTMEQENKEKEKTRKQINDMIILFKESAKDNITALSASTDTLGLSANEMMEIAESAGIDVDLVSQGTEQTAENIKVVAGASERLSSSVSDITTQIQKSNDIVHKAVSVVENANTSAKSLDDASVKIGEIIILIQDITEQINLLALNATIESARAGDAGKGFAVVASEVKKLAGQANKATEEIGSQIDGMQLVSQEVILSLNDINNSVSSIMDYSNNISSAVEEQNQMTIRISDSMQQASTETNNVTKNMRNVSVASTYVTSSANDLLATSKGLIENSEQIKQNIQTFIDSMSQFN
ncbi:MAG: methyl-accepting chemotaxis protein [Rickettsiales bacterium]|nr:methyl-accepting chemotaxis protein [Rickettsiales bacterium]